MNPKWGSKAGSYHRQTDKEEEEDRTGFTLVGDQKQEGEETQVHRQEVNTIKLKQEITNKQILNILNSYTKHGIKSNPANSIIWFFWTALSKVKKVKMNPKFKQIQKKSLGTRNMNMNVGKTTISLGELCEMHERKLQNS